MSNDYNYGWEKLYSAVHGLIGAADLKTRLCHVLWGLATTLNGKEHHIPKEIRDDFIKFMKEMSCKDAIGNEGTIMATLNSLNETELSRVAEKILSFYDTTCRYQKPF